MINMWGSLTQNNIIIVAQINLMYVLDLLILPRSCLLVSVVYCKIMINVWGSLTQNNIIIVISSKSIINKLMLII